EVSKSTISLYETGDTVPDAKMIVRMCKIFDMSCDYFLCQSDYRSSEQSHRTLEDMGLDETATKQIDDL
ncbi:MAG: helix-turn-helix domain-containing protein, partial [Oscillospiraceae bacterium]|nr:helix-turn-helix domain-containing protein [Oscillospiraceae bacterium]